MSLDVLTFGCRLNAYESEVIAGHAAALRDTLVVNTCAVTIEAERQARHAVARAHRARPSLKIVVTGCAAQIAPARWAALPGVSRVLGNAEKLAPEHWTEDAQGASADIVQARAVASPPPAVFAGRSRALVQVQQGCDHRCTYCVIPYGRGANRSVPLETVVERVRALSARGFHEVVLTGVDIASYGADLPGCPTLGSMLRALLSAVPELPRLRLSSLDPAAIDTNLLELVAGESRLMPHLHLSLQAGSDLVLKRMKRRHTAEQAALLIAELRALRPGIALGADLIAGFPTETDALFEETLAFLKAAQLPYLHVFPYSERPGTPAARMPSVPHAVRRARAALLRAEGARAAETFFAAQSGRVAQVLTEAARPNAANGRTEFFCPVHLAGDWPPGRLVRARVAGANAHGLLAEAA